MLSRCEADDWLVERTIPQVGRPIQVKQNANPSKAELEEVQSRYIAELERIWEQWKDAYAANRSKELTIVD